MTPEEIIKTAKTYAIIGASGAPDRYGYELTEVMHHAGLTIFPVNPKYPEILGVKCYPSLQDVPQKPDVVITAVAPHNTLKAIETAAEMGIHIVWMPQECWSEDTIQKCKELNLDFVYDVCPISYINAGKCK
jgi:hypothetical protein